MPAQLPNLAATRWNASCRDAVLTARRAGLGSASIQELFESALAVGSRGGGVVGFVECNERDLYGMATLVENSTGVALQPMLIGELRPGWEADFDVVAVPMFHLADLVELTVDLDRVVELNFIPSRGVLRQLATIPPSDVVAVAAPTPRGVERMRGLVGQYYGGTVLTPDLDSDAPFEGVDVLVHPWAIAIGADLLARIRREVVIDWELDPGSAATFAGRIAVAMEGRDNVAK